MAGLMFSGVAHAADDLRPAVQALLGPDGDTPEGAPTALAPWPGGPQGALVVAVLTDAAADPASDTLGPLRVGLLSRQDGHFTVLASDTDADWPDLSRAYTPSMTHVAVDPAVFTIAPDEVAVGIDVGVELTTESVHATASTLVLYRRQGARLSPIFHIQTDDTSEDGSTQHIVRISPHLTRGFHDLVVVRRGARGGRTFVWNGARYVPGRR